MLNIKKGDFLSLITDLAQTCNTQWTDDQVRKSAEEIFINSIPKRKGSTDRLVFNGYVVLLERDVSYERLAHPDKLLNMNFLFSKKGMELYLRNECYYYGLSHQETERQLNKIMRSMCRNFR